jgi:hypothetical protein
LKLHDDAKPDVSVALHVTNVSPTLKIDPEGGLQPNEATATLSTGVKTHDWTLVFWSCGKALMEEKGQETSGFWLSVTTTLNEHDALFPTASLAVQPTLVLPTRKKVVPMLGLQVNDITPTLSIAAGLVHETIPDDASTEVNPETSDGHVMTGGVVSCTDTLNEHWAVLLDVSVAVQTTTVEPSWNVDPEAGKQVTDWMATLSEPKGVI